MNKKLKAVVAIVCVAALGFGGFKIYQHFNSKPAFDKNQFSDRTSLAERVIKGSMQEVVTASGSVSLADEIFVYAEGETNKIKTFHVEEGDKISVGQLLVTYDVEDQKEELEKKIRDLKLSIENAQLSLDSITVGKTEKELIQLENEIISAQKSYNDTQTNYKNYDTKISQQETAIKNAQTEIDNANLSVDNAKKDWDRAITDVSNNARLLEVGGISQSEYDDSVDQCSKAEESYNYALQSLERARQDYDEALTSLESIKEEKASASLSIETAKNNLEVAQINLENAKDIFSDEATLIKYKQQLNTLQTNKDSLADCEEDLAELVYSTNSTVEGYVTEICVDEGTYTEENTVMLKVADFNKLIVNCSVAEYDAPAVKVGQKVVMVSDGLENKEYNGTITKVNLSASSANTIMGSETAVPVEISVDNPDSDLKPGYNLDLEIYVVDRPDVLTVSETAISTNEETKEKFVYKVIDKKLVKAIVEVGDTSEAKTEIISGLKEGDEVISSITEEMHDGMGIDELKPVEVNIPTRNSDNQNGGMKNDQGNGFNQMLPPGGNQGGRPGGGMPGGFPR